MVNRAASHNQYPKTIGKLGKVIALGGSVVALWALTHHPKAEPIQNATRIEAQAIHKAKYAWNNVVIVKSGAEYRSVPVMELSGDTSTTKIGKVGKDQRLEIFEPIVYEDNQGDTWLGYSTTFKENSPTTIRGGASSGNVNWINFTQLEGQTSSEGPLVQVYADPHSPMESPILNVQISTDGNFSGFADGLGYPIAAGSIVSTEAAQLTVQGLTLDPNR